MLQWLCVVALQSTICAERPAAFVMANGDTTRFSSLHKFSPPHSACFYNCLLEPMPTFNRKWASLTQRIKRQKSECPLGPSSSLLSARNSCNNVPTRSPLSLFSLPLYCAGPMKKSVAPSSPPSSQQMPKSASIASPLSSLTTPARWRTTSCASTRRARLPQRSQRMASSASWMSWPARRLRPKGRRRR